jgi:hypothetical protein
LGLGEHYFIDLVAAFPFAVMIHAACTLNVPISNARRVIPLVAGVGMMVGWMLLRWGLPVFWISPVVPWSMIAGTVFLTLLLLSRLRPLLLNPVEHAGREFGMRAREALNAQARR